jgi:hypothetical protein
VGSQQLPADSKKGAIDIIAARRGAPGRLGWLGWRGIQLMVTQQKMWCPVKEFPCRGLARSCLVLCPEFPHPTSLPPWPGVSPLQDKRFHLSPAQRSQLTFRALPRDLSFFQVCSGLLPTRLFSAASKPQHFAVLSHLEPTNKSYKVSSDVH